MNDRSIPEHFRFCPSCGRPSVGLAEGKLNSVQCSHCDFTLFFNPTSAAGALIRDDQGRLLVIERARDPAKGKFGIPGGFTDFGERLEEVLLREVKEEINLELNSYSFLASFPNEYRYKSVVYPVIDTYFLAEVDSFEAMKAEVAEVAGIRFVKPAEVPDEQWAFPSLRKVIRLYLERHS